MLFFLLKKIVGALILPPTCLILLAFFGIWLSQKHVKAGRSVVAFSLFILLILSLPLTANALLHSLESTPPISEAQLKEIQAIVILGGGTNSLAPEYGIEDTVNRWTLERLRYGAYLQRQTGNPILVTGGAPYGGRPEADTMADTLKKDFHAKDIWIEPQSKDTAENAAYSVAIFKELGIQRVAIVSHAWHLTRAIKLFEQEGLTAYPAPTGYTTNAQLSIALWFPDAGALNKSSIALKEYLGHLASSIAK